MSVLAFRIRSNYDKRIVSLKGALEKNNVMVTKNGLEFLNNNYVLELSTGITDRNNNEIYRGDIVRQTAPDYDFMRDYPEGILLEVKYGVIDVDELVPQFYLAEYGEEDREEWRETFIDYYDYEVAGNIHQGVIK